MAKRKRAIPQYGTVTLNGIDYYRTRVQNADGKLVALYARTPEELYDQVAVICRDSNPVTTVYELVEFLNSKRT